MRETGEDGEVLQKGDVEEDGLDFDEAAAVCDGDCGAEGEGDVVEREDAESAAGVEVAEAVGLTDGVPKDASDEEAGENEEKRDAGPAGSGELAEETDDEVRGFEASTVVEDEDHEDSEAA